MSRPSSPTSRPQSGRPSARCCPACSTVVALSTSAVDVEARTNHRSSVGIYIRRTTPSTASASYWLRSLTASDRSRAVPSRIKSFFFYVRAIRFAFFNSGRNQSERSYFAPTKTCDETTNGHAHLFTVLRGNGEF